MKGRIRIVMEYHPDKGNPVAVQDSIVIFDGEDLMAKTDALYNTTAHRFALDVEGAERGAL